MSKFKEILLTPIFKDNPIALQILGICSALVVTSKLYPTLIMCVALTITVSLSNFYFPYKKHNPNEYKNYCSNDHYFFFSYFIRSIP